MGNSRYDDKVTRAYMTNTATLSAADYRNTSDWNIDKKYSPKEIKVRESKSSVLNPNPTPIIVGLDVSGSMERIVEAMRKGLGTLFKQIIERAPVSDPHVMAMAIGDMDAGDNAPVQATQFEADPVTIGKQIEELYLEGGGGGNRFESYLGPLYFALNRTDCDAFKGANKRRGFLFTVGDEEPQQYLNINSISRYFGDKIQSNIKAEDIIRDVSENWNYFHLIAMEGSYARRCPQTVGLWTNLISQNAIKLTDHTKMAEVITSLIEVTAGRARGDVVDSWDTDTAAVIAEAVKNVPTAPVIDLT